MSHVARRSLLGLWVGLAGLCGLGALAGCGGSSGPAHPACNPLGGEGCLLPWPSMAYATPDPTSKTGYRLALTAAAMPMSVDGIVVDPAPWNRWDGFSPAGPILVSFSTGIDDTNLPPFGDPDKSLAADSPIVLLDYDTGERAPFFAELDANIAPTAPADAALIIRPLVRLKPSGHYIVALRKSLKSATRGDLPISPAFAALRDGGGFDHPLFPAIKATGAAIFDKLATAGVPKDDLVLAWDYVTASDDFLTSDLTKMRAAALPAMGTNGSALSFTVTETPPDVRAYKSYLGTFKSPDFLTDGEKDVSIIRRDATGAPQLGGMRDANLAVIIPKCVTTHALPIPTIVFGHGLFGSGKEYIADGFTLQLAQDNCFVIVAGDFIGLTSRQLALAPLAANDMNKAYQISEKLGQSIIDFISLETLAHNKMVSDPAFHYMGQPIIDPTKIFYVGGSLGGIMGNTFMAYDPNITRGVLAVPGGNWSLLFERSAAWTLLQGATMGAYPDLQLYQPLIALLGMAMEPYDPITTAAHVIKDPMAGTPVKDILMWYAVGDCLVNNISTEMVARTMGIDMIGPSLKTPWHVNVRTDVAAMTNGIFILNDHPTPLPPISNVPPATDNGTHSGINRKPAPLRSVTAYLLQSKVIQACVVNGQPAPCDCATGACD
jgi:hypothetical protein